MSTQKETKHTPGPWLESGTMIYSPGEHGANICEVSEPRATELVKHTPVKRGSPDRYEAYANARLIASAPEMYEALKTIMTRTTGTRYANKKGLACIRAIAEAALTKAEEGQ